MFREDSVLTDPDPGELRVLANIEAIVLDSRLFQGHPKEPMVSIDPYPPYPDVRGDVYTAEHILYVNEINRAAAICHTLLNARRVFDHVFVFRFLDQILEEGTRHQKEANEGNLLSPGPYICQLMDERDLDNHLIGSFFELLGKACLLEAGFLVHVIKARRWLNP